MTGGSGNRGHAGETVGGDSRVRDQYNRPMQFIQSITIEPIESDPPQEDLAQLLSRGISALGQMLPLAAVEVLLRHNALLRHWNPKVNLTAITDPVAMVVEHQLDSLAIAPWMQGRRILDVGSGGGFPGIPLAVALPQVSFTLLDSRSKRVGFLRHAVTTLGLDNVTVVQCRVENFRPAEKFDTLVCRALAPLEQILHWTRALHHPGTCLVAMKGSAVAQEVAALPEPWCRTARTEPIRVPFLDAHRYVVCLPFA